VLISYVDSLVSLLPSVPPYWKTFNQYFTVLAHFAGLSTSHAKYLVRRGLLAQLIDLYLGDESPHPDVGKIPVGANGKRVPLGTKHSKPELNNFFHLLSLLVQVTDVSTAPVELTRQISTAPSPVVSKQTTSEVPSTLALDRTPSLERASSVESMSGEAEDEADVMLADEEHTPAESKGSTTSTVADKKVEKKIVLTTKEKNLLLCKPFLNQLICEATSRKRGQFISKLIEPMCYDNEKVTTNIVSLVTLGIDEKPYDQLRSYFRVLIGLVAIDDSLQAKRVDWIMASLLQAIESNLKYWKCTDFSLEYLIRMCNASPLVLEWLRRPANITRIDQFIVWLMEHSHPPWSHSRDEDGVRLHKPSKVVQEWAQTSLATHHGLPISTKREILQNIRDNKDIAGEDDDIDSDVDLSERILALHDYIDVLDDNMWRGAQVVRVFEDSRKVEIHFEGLGDNWNETLPMSSTRIMPYGRHTRKTKPSASVSAGSGMYANPNNYYNSYV